MKADYRALSHIGRVRKVNEDHFLLDPSLGLAIVADGVGGLARGEAASALACRVVRQHLQHHRRQLDRFSGEGRQRLRIHERLREAVQRASAEVFQAAATIAPTRGMSCTLDVTLGLGTELFVAHVGDSRVYRLREGALTRLTHDHSVGEEKVRLGLLQPEEVRSKPGFQALTRAVGALPSVKVDTSVFPLEPGDRFLLCTDGLTRHIPDEELPEVMAGESEGALAQAIRLANRRGGRDNITAVLVSFPLDGPAESPVTAAQLEELRSVVPFEAATMRELLVLRRQLVTREVRPGTLLFREGEYGGEMFFVLQGEVALTRSGHLLTKAGPGSVFGEMALFDQPVRSASALATRDTRFLVLTRDRFEQLMRTDDAVAVRLLSGLVHKLSGVVRFMNRRLDPERG